MKKIKTFEDACLALGISNDIPDFSNTPEKHKKAFIAYYKLVIINQALNKEWEPNWEDWNEHKYFPWFDFNKGSDRSSGFGFSCRDWAGSDAFATVGSRLCFKSSALAEYAGKQFLELYKDYFVIA